MNLEKKQRAIQNESYTLLEERIEKLNRGQTKEFAEAQGILGYMQKLILEIDAFKQEYLQEVLGKVICEKEVYYCELLGVEYKNIHDAIAQPLAIMILDKKRNEEALDRLQESKKKFQEMPRDELKRKLQESVKYSKKRISLEGDIYAFLGREDGKEIFKDTPQRVALAIWQISSNDLAVMLMGQLLSLKNIDDADSDNTGNTRQTFGAEVGALAHQRIAWRFLRDIEALKDDELKKAYRNYDNNYFEGFEQLSHSLWTEVLALEVGQKLIDLAQKVSIIGEYQKPHDDGNFNYLKLDKTFLEKMNDTDKKLAYSASMIFKPMVMEPLEWKEMYGGGFLPDEGEENRFDLSLIKASSCKDREALSGKKIPQTVLAGINQMQKTAFCVNEKMLEVLLDYHNDISFLKKENRVDFAYYRILRELLSSEKDVHNKKKVYEHFEKSKFIKLNREKELTRADKKRISKAIKSTKKEEDIEVFRLQANIYYEIAKYKQGFDTIVNIAKEMKAYDKFYFVWRMDFRGRVYPQQTLLNPQSGDLPKALLLFSEKKALNKEGLKWFYVHGANCYGEVDKRPFDERLAWIKENHDAILSSAKNYRNENFWKQAGDPFKFLAWCFEYGRYVGNPETFITGIPVAIDGSNNGFQHITALLCDKQGAEKVNVLPHYDDNEVLVVADFYADVANKLRTLLEEEYDAFENEKENLIEKDGLFYTVKELKELEASYYFDRVATFIDSMEFDDLKHGQFYSSYVMQNKDKIDWGKVKFSKKEFDIIEKDLDKIDRKIRKDVGEEDSEELKYSILDELERLAKRAKRQLENGKCTEKKGKVFRLKEKLKLDARSLYRDFIEKGIIKRGFVKKPVMTESYGSRTAGKAKKILEDIEADGILSALDEDDRYKVAFQITIVLEKALTHVSDSPQKYKEWMKSYAKEIAKEFAIEWRTPLGLEVKQVEYKANKVKVSIGGGRKVEFKVYTDELDGGEHQKGLSPNFIHSLDASHLIMTINGLKQVGIDDLMTVHDSFSTHANDVGRMSKVLRKSFVALHNKEILQELTEFFYEKFSIEYKKVPYVDKKNFDLEKVMDSEYFFG